MWRSTVNRRGHPASYGGYVPNGGHRGPHLADFRHLSVTSRERNDGAQVNGIGRRALSKLTRWTPDLDRAREGRRLDGTGR